MQSAFKNLTQDELEELCLVPIWVSILIAGADNKIQGSEVKRAIKIIKEKQKIETAVLNEYYNRVAGKFEINLKGYITLLPKNQEERSSFLLQKLERVNYFFSKIEKDIAYQLYLSFRDFANKIAHASGGLFGLLSVSFAESKYIDLKMITDPSSSHT